MKIIWNAMYNVYLWNKVFFGKIFIFFEDGQVTFLWLMSLKQEEILIQTMIVSSMAKRQKINTLHIPWHTNFRQTQFK